MVFHPICTIFADEIKLKQMKKIIFLLLLICCYGCSESTTDMNEVTAQQMYNSIKGTYAGNIMVDNIPQKINITIGNDLSVRYLPLRPILGHVFSGAELDEAEKSAGSVTFTIPLDQMMIAEGNIYLTLEPADLVFSVTVDNKIYTVSALVEGTAFANKTTDNLTMSLDVTALNCEGTSYDMKNNGINYFVDSAKKE